MLTSGKPPVLLEITGTPQAIASKAARPKLSFSEGRMNKSEKQRILSTSLLFPKNKTLSSIPFVTHKRSQSSRSGPSPTIISFALIFSEFGQRLQ